MITALDLHETVVCRLIRMFFAQRVQYLGAFFGVFLVLCSMPNTAAQAVYSVNIVGVVANKTKQLLSTPLTTEQRQVLHAKNFSQLHPLARPLYLRGVAYSVGFIVQLDGEALPSSAALADYLESASFGASSFENLSDLSYLAHKAVVKEVMREL